MSYLVRAEATAEDLGVRLRVAPTPGALWGVYDHPHKLITLRPGLGALQRDWTIWHELGHAYYGHVGCYGKTEAQASKWALAHMFDPDAFASELIPDMTDKELACALGVLPYVIQQVREVYGSMCPRRQ